MNPRAGALQARLEHIVYIFEGFRLDAGRRQLSSRGGVVVPLNSRAMEALLLLVTHPGTLVTKRQLLEGVWPAAVVEDNNINQCVLAIRKALGESAGSNRFIMTIPGRGYRFVAPVIVQNRETADESGNEKPAPSRFPVNAGILAIAASLAAMLFGLAVPYLRRDMPGDASKAPGASGQPDLVVKLRRDAGASSSPAAALLLDCLRQRPDLHLRIEVHVVGTSSSPPVWTGQFIAGAEDVLHDEASRQVDPDACCTLSQGLARIKCM